jgi:hypothetical protein
MTFWDDALNQTYLKIVYLIILLVSDTRMFFSQSKMYD